MRYYPHKCTLRKGALQPTLTAQNHGSCCRSGKQEALPSSNAQVCQRTQGRKMVCGSAQEYCVQAERHTLALGSWKWRSDVPREDPNQGYRHSFQLLAPLSNPLSMCVWQYDGTCLATIQHKNITVSIQRCLIAMKVCTLPNTCLFPGAISLGKSNSSLVLHYLS